MNCQGLILIFLIEMTAVSGVIGKNHSSPASRLPGTELSDNPFKSIPQPDSVFADSLTNPNLPISKSLKSASSPSAKGDSVPLPGGDFSRPSQDSITTATDNDSTVLPDSTSAPPQKRKPYAGLQVGILFSDFKQSLLFSADLDTINRKRKIEDEKKADELNSSNPGLVHSANKSQTLQPYDNVLYGFPFGLYTGLPINRYFDLLASFQFYWKKQGAVVETRGLDIINIDSDDTTRATAKNQSYNYFIQYTLFGLGAKFYLPEEFITIGSGTHLYLSFLYYWNLYNSELYSYAGSQNAKYGISGVGLELNAGYQIAIWKQFLLIGEISLSRLNFQSSGEWRDVLRQNNETKMSWELNSLKFNFLFLLPFGHTPAIPLPKASSIPIRK